MVEFQTPLNTPDIGIRPPLEGRQPFDVELKRTIAMIAGKSDSDMRLLKCSPSGVLTVCSNILQDIVHITGVGANYAYVGDAQQVSEVMIMGHPSNAALIWVTRDKVATVDNGWPLAKNDVLTLSLTNLSDLNILIVGAGEKAIIAYTR